MAKLNMNDAKAMFLAMVPKGKGAVPALAVIDKQIAWIKTTGTKMDAVMHSTAVACLAASQLHENGGHHCPLRFAKMLNAMPRGSRAKTLADWAEHFSNLRAKYDKKAGEWKVGILTSASKGYKEQIDLIAAFAKPFYEVEEKTDGAKAFDVGALMAQLVRAIEKADKGEVSMSEDDRAAAGKLLAFANENGIRTAKLAVAA